MSKPKVLLFDTETTALRGDSGNLLVISYKWLGEKKVHTLRIDQFPLYKKDPIDDSELVKAFEQVYIEAEVTCAHYGAEFDVKMLHSRRAIKGLKPLPPTKIYDTWYAAKMTFNLKSNSVKNLAEVFGLDEQKMPVKWEVWRRAAYGHKPSLNILAKRCESDVRVLEMIYLKLRAFAPQYMPNVFGVKDSAVQCRACGEEGRMQARGWSVTKQNRFARYQCQRCGAWQRGKKEKV